MSTEESETLTLLGKVATDQPMNRWSLDAERLLRKYGHTGYLMRCDRCGGFPAHATEEECDDAE